MPAVLVFDLARRIQYRGYLPGEGRARIMLVPHGITWDVPQRQQLPMLTPEQRQFLTDLSLVLGVAVAFVTLYNALAA